LCIIIITHRCLAVWILTAELCAGTSGTDEIEQRLEIDYSYFLGDSNGGDGGGE
jgi:hypothetical protein